MEWPPSCRLLSPCFPCYSRGQLTHGAGKAAPESAVGNANGSRTGRCGNGTPQTGCLPREGDRMLDVTLSKAMLLAKDTGIADPTIVGRLSRPTVIGGCDSAHTGESAGARPK
ncbi:DUF7737 domain-containing protein [Streptomyces stelliscabiei]